MVRIITQRDPQAVRRRLEAVGMQESAVHDLNLRDIYLEFCRFSEETGHDS